MRKWPNLVRHHACQMRFLGLVRSEGLEPPRFYSLPPQGSASTNSATSACWGSAMMPDRINGAGCNKSKMGRQGLPVRWFGYRELPNSRWARLADARQPRQHLLDFDRDTVAVDEHDPAGDRQVVGENFDLVGLGRVQFDDGAAAQPHYLMDRHRRGPEDHHEIDGDFIKRWHWETGLTIAKLRGSTTPRYG
jgi:hypothetical protein